MVKIRPAIAGILFVSLSLILLYRGIFLGAATAMIAGAGLMSLIVLSLLFLLFGFYSLLKIARGGEHCSSILPGSAVIAAPYALKVDPRRTRFLPGIRLSVHWKLSFGPFRYQTAAPLPVEGIGEAQLCIPRRGEWQVRSFLRASDPFGFFHFDFICRTERKISAPPLVLLNDVSDIPGRPAAERATAPRLKEDSEERLERRSYVPGDDPRRLDWKVFARTGEMFVRVGEESVPNRGRIWLLLVCADYKVFRKKAQVQRLDFLIQAMAAMVQHLEDDGQDVRVRLPGEEQWGGSGSGWEGRLARSLPPLPSNSFNNYPSSGERIWILAHPRDRMGLSVAREVVTRGCRVSLAYPSPEYSTPFRWLKSRMYRKQLAEAESEAEKGGLDVRRI